MNGRAKENAQELISTNKKRVLFTVLSFFSIYLIAYLIDPFSSYWEDYFQHSAVELVFDWGGTLLCCVLISELSVFVHNRLNRVLSWTEKPTKRQVWEISEGEIKVTFSAGEFSNSIWGIYLPECS